MTQNVRLERPWGNGRIVWTRDATANDSDKTFTVPAGKIWKMIWIEGLLINSADAGNRFFGCQIAVAANLVYSSGSAQSTANQVSMFRVSFEGYAPYDVTTLVPRFTDISASVNVSIRDSLPPLILPEAATIRLWDTSAIAALADDLTVILHYIEYDA